MKFLLVSPFSNVSGSAVRFCNIAQELRKNGHEIVYVERYIKGTFRNHPEGVTCYTTPVLGNLFLDISLSFLHNLLILMSHLNVDIYYALKPAPNNCFPALLAKLLGKRIILDVDDLDYGYFKPGLKRNISRFFFDRFPGYFEIITCHTELLKKHLREKLNIPESKIHFLPQGISSVFRFFKCDTNTNRKPNSIVYMASLGLTSDFGDLLPILKQICDRYPETSICVIGDGLKKKHYEKKVSEMNLKNKITFVGLIEHDQVPSLLARHTVGINYLRPSETNNCRAILKIREYLAVGLQVVCNKAGDADVFREYIHVAENTEEMEGVIEKVLQSTQGFNALGRQFIFRKFQWCDIVREFENRIGLTEIA